MAIGKISVDRVYQKVLALANKEQRGYITPQEFNLFADHAQMEIFEQYFYDLNQFARLPGNDFSHSDVVSNIQEKISLFERRDFPINIGGTGEDLDHILNFAMTPNLYRLTRLRVNYGNGYKVAERIETNELDRYGNSPLGAWSKSRPVYAELKGSSGAVSGPVTRVYPAPVLLNNEPEVLLDFIHKPLKPNWAYVVVNNKPLYNSTSSTDFELHQSEEVELVYRILALSGITIEKPQLTQIAAGLQTAQIQQEKQ